MLQKLHMDNSSSNEKYEMHAVLKHFKDEVDPHILRIAEDVWRQKDQYVCWPKHELLFSPVAIRKTGFCTYSREQLAQLKAAGFVADRRSNGPAVMAYLIAKGKRPMRASSNRGWHIHHIYDGKFVAPGKQKTLHAVKDGDHFTQAAGLVAVHPIADALADEVGYFAWLLRREAYKRFGYDPDQVLAGSPSEPLEMFKSF